jgi:hypothetical protein
VLEFTATTTSRSEPALASQSSAPRNLIYNVDGSPGQEIRTYNLKIPLTCSSGEILLEIHGSQQDSTISGINETHGIGHAHRSLGNRGTRQ